jgi:TonB family protein
MNRSRAVFRRVCIAWSAVGWFAACLTGVAWANSPQLQVHEICALPDVQELPARVERAPADMRPRYPLKALRANQGADVELRIQFARNGTPIDQRVCANSGRPEFAMAAMAWARTARVPAVPDRTDSRSLVRTVRLRFDPQRERELRRLETVGVDCPGYRDVRYPDDARRAGVEGTTSVRFYVDTDGRIYSVDVFQSSGSAVLDAAVIQHVKMLECDPGNLSGPARVELEFDFALTAAERAAARRAAAPAATGSITGSQVAAGQIGLVRFESGPIGATGPTRGLCGYRMAYPAATQRQAFVGKTRVSFVMGVNGKTKDFRVVQSSGQPDLDEAVREHVLTMECPPLPREQRFEIDYEFKPG